MCALFCFGAGKECKLNSSSSTKNVLPSSTDSSIFIYCQFTIHSPVPCMLFSCFLILFLLYSFFVFVNVVVWSQLQCLTELLARHGSIRRREKNRKLLQHLAEVCFLNGATNQKNPRFRAICLVCLLACHRGTTSSVVRSILPFVPRPFFFVVQIELKRTRMRDVRATITAWILLLADSHGKPIPCPRQPNDRESVNMRHGQKNIKEHWNATDFFCWES